MLEDADFKTSRPVNSTKRRTRRFTKQIYTLIRQWMKSFSVLQCALSRLPAEQKLDPAPGVSRINRQESR